MAGNISLSFCDLEGFSLCSVMWFEKPELAQGLFQRKDFAPQMSIGIRASFRLYEESLIDGQNWASTAFVERSLNFFSLILTHESPKRAEPSIFQLPATIVPSVVNPLGSEF